MTKSTYDFLNSLAYVGILIFIYIYNQHFRHIEAWIMILFSLSLFFLMTYLMYMNVMKLNTRYGISDIEINALIFLVGTQSISTLATLPV